MGAIKNPEQRSYRPGEIVPFSGIYHVVHSDQNREADTIVLLETHPFPACDDCADVRFVLMREAPYIHEDDDFRSYEGLGLVGQED